MDWLKRTFDPGGRTGRIGYWRFQILAALLVVTALGACLLLIQAGQRLLAAVVLLVPLLSALIVSMLIAIRRAHDRGRSAVWVAIFVVGPPLLTGLGALATLHTGNRLLPLALALDLASLALSLWGLVEFGFLRGTRGPNAFGPEPVRR